MQPTQVYFPSQFYVVFFWGGVVILPLSIKMTCRFGLEGLPMKPPYTPPLTVTYIESHSPSNEFYPASHQSLSRSIKNSRKIIGILVLLVNHTFHVRKMKTVFDSS